MPSANSGSESSWPIVVPNARKPIWASGSRKNSAIGRATPYPTRNTPERKPRRSNAPGRDANQARILAWFASRPGAFERRGFLSGVFLVGYGVARPIAEFFREPDAHIGFLALGTTMGQLLSLPLFALGIWLIVTSRKNVSP